MSESNLRMHKDEYTEFYVENLIEVKEALPFFKSNPQKPSLTPLISSIIKSFSLTKSKKIQFLTSQGLVQEGDSFIDNVEQVRTASKQLQKLQNHAESKQPKKYKN